jgi:hypothetical protein
MGGTGVYGRKRGRRAITKTGTGEQQAQKIGKENNL